SARSCSRQFRFAKGAGRGPSATGSQLGSAARHCQFTTRLAAGIRHHRRERSASLPIRGGLCRLTEAIAFRLVANKRSPAASDVPPPPKLLEHGSFLSRLYASKAPVQIPDLQ